jgi:hypothetical protein
VALFVKKGGCSVQQKAIAASTLINPPNLVQYIIVDGAKDISDEYPDDDQEKQLRLGDGATDEDMVDWEEKYGEMEETSSEIVNDDEPVMTVGRVLRRSKNKQDKDKIKVAVLHVTYTAGYVLLDALLHEDTPTRQAGGTKILLDNKEPGNSAQAIFLWVLLSATLSASACCCLILFISRGFLEDEQHAPPPQPVRRRLTHEQVRESYPLYAYEQDLIAEEHAFHECSICLDEYSPGVRVRRLPCQHVFHGNCIARWLIERSATCPLCKTDLYEDDEESSDEEETSPPERMPTWWGEVLSRVAQEPLTLTVDAENTPTNQQPNWWWRGREGVPTTTVSDAGNEPANLQPNRWSMTSGSTGGEPNRSTGWIANLFGWRRRQAVGPSLTELTEPLLVVEESRDEAPAADTLNAVVQSPVAPLIDEAQPTPVSQPRRAIEGSSSPPTNEYEPLPTESSVPQESSSRPATSAEV